MKKKILGVFLLCASIAFSTMAYAQDLGEGSSGPAYMLLAELGGGMHHMYMTLDASHELVQGKVRPARITRDRLFRTLERKIHPGVEKGWRWKLSRRFRRMRRGVW